MRGIVCRYLFWNRRTSFDVIHCSFISRQLDSFSKNKNGWESNSEIEYRSVFWSHRTSFSIQNKTRFQLFLSQNKWGRRCALIQGVNRFFQDSEPCVVCREKFVVVRAVKYLAGMLCTDLGGVVVHGPNDGCLGRLHNQRALEIG